MIRADGQPLWTAADSKIAVPFPRKRLHNLGEE